MNNDIRDYKTIKEVAAEWGVTVRRVQMLCTSGKLPGVKKYGRSWILPKDVVRPIDNRIVSGKFVTANKTNKKMKRIEPDTDFRLVLKISHDIRTMLNSVLGYSDLIQKNAKDPQRVMEYSKNVECSGRTMLRLTTNVLEYVRGIEGKTGSEPTAFSLESIPREVIRYEYEDIKRKKLNINYRTDLKHEIIFSDKNKVGLALSNLFNNAVKAASDGQDINFFIEELEETEPGIVNYKYVIEDFGVGMSESVRERLENYDHDYENTDIAITGLGVPVAKGLIEQMEGTISFVSKPHVGTKVTVIIPHRVSDLSIAADPTASTLPQDAFKGKRVLIADDNELNREIAAEILTEYGFKVETAADGIICVAMLEQQPDDYYDFILMDIQMPNIDGILATKIIRGLKDKKRAAIPIIAATANVAKEERNRAITAGMNGFLEKPLKIEQLLAILERVMG